MSTLSTPKGIAVVVQDPEVARHLPRVTGLRRYTRPSGDLLERYHDIFVAVSLLGLPPLADFIREANNRHYLRGLFVRDAHHSQLLPQLLAKANLRTLRNLIVHTDTRLPARVLNAYCRGAEEELIADARWVQDHLFVLSCTGETFELAVKEVPVLKELAPAVLNHFELADDGSYLHWPQADLHLNLEVIRTLLDPQRQQQKALERLQNDQLFGQAITVLRQHYQLRQVDIEGLSARHVRRIEAGHHPRPSSLQRLATAHGLSVPAYLDQIAETIHSLKEEAS